MLLDIIVRDGNVLLNVGPDRDGVIPAAHVQRLREVGEWMSKYADSIYGTRGGPFQPTQYYGSTYKDNKIYVHIRSWPQTGAIELPAIPQMIRSSSILMGGKALVQQDQQRISIDVSPDVRKAIDTVVVLELETPVTEIIKQ